MNVYDVGDMVRIRGIFTDSGGSAVDPSSVTFQYMRKDTDAASTLVYGVNSITKAAVGNYYTDVAVNSGGPWKYRWNGTGANAAAVEGAFDVRWRGVA